jgi:tagatose 6-phosphate kinase
VNLPAEQPRRVVFVAANPSIDRMYEVDRLTEGAIHRPDLVVARPGGKGLNAARAASLLGGRVTAIGIVGGRAGDWIVDQLAELDIDAPMARSATETRTCISILDRSTGMLTELYEVGGAIEHEAWDRLEVLLARELERGDAGALTMSGSLPPGAPIDGYARLARIAAGSVPILADVYGPALAALLAERPAVLKVNAVEAGEAAGLPVDDPRAAVAAARALRDRGAGAVIVTLGAAGAIAVDSTQAVQLVPPDVRGAYPVGSGDAFLAGLAVALVAGATVIEAARHGLAAGIANALLPGSGDLDPTVARHLAAEVRLATF